MSLATNIKDYIEVINTTLDGVFNTVNLETIGEAILLLLSRMSSLFLYLITFQWFRDFGCFPLRVPQVSPALLRERFVLNGDNSGFNLLAFSQPAVFTNNKLVLGFINSFFFSLPVSAGHLIAVRRLLIQGIPAGIAAGLGLVLGHCLLVTSVVFGLRSVTIPWFSCEPFPFLVGLYLTTTVIYDMTLQRSLALIKGSDRFRLVQISLLSFFLCWTEQSCVLQGFSNLNLDPSPSPLELYSSTFPLPQLTYSTGFLIGSVFFTYVIGFCLLWLFRFIPTRIGMLFSRWVNLLNSGLLSLIFAFAVTTISWYGFDYLVAKPLGFLAQDKTWVKPRTLFSPSIDVITTWLITEGLETGTHLGPAADIQPFQRTLYSKNVNKPKAYEEFSFEGEYHANAPMFRLRNIAHLENLGKRVGSRIGAFLESRLEGVVSTSTPLKVYRSRTVSPAQKTRRETNKRFYQVPKPVWVRRDIIPFRARRLENLETSLKLKPSSKHRSLLKRKLKFYQKQKIAQHKRGLPHTENLNLAREEWNLDKEFDRKFYRARFYRSPVYKLLLHTQIDLFVDEHKQQPRLLLTPSAEADLVHKRLKLAGYFNTLRLFGDLNRLEGEAMSKRGEVVNMAEPVIFKFSRPDSRPPAPSNKNHSSSGGDKAFRSSGGDKVFHPNAFFKGTKSYATHPYNQQFKGTSKVVRRLFSLTLPRQERNETHNVTQTGNVLLERVLKFDQPLFRNKDLATWHEELPLEGVERGNVLKSDPDEKVRLGEGSWTSKSKTPDLFMQFTESTPLYAGWDQKGQRFVLTNSLLSRTVSGRRVRETTHVLVPFQTVQVTKQSGSIKPLKGFESRVKDSTRFRTWPLNKVRLADNLLDRKIRRSNDNPFRLFAESRNHPRFYKYTHPKTVKENLPLFSARRSAAAYRASRKAAANKAAREELLAEAQRTFKREANRVASSKTRGWLKRRALTLAEERGKRGGFREGSQAIKREMRERVKLAHRLGMGWGKKNLAKLKAGYKKTEDKTYFPPHANTGAIVPPSRGGSVWPGEKHLEINFNFLERFRR